LVETVGVGQSEVAVADLVDLFVLVASPVGGDEQQGMKRGIMELADVIVVNKADGDLVDAAERSAGDLRNAVHLLRPTRPGWEVEVRTCSALEGTGITELREHLEQAHDRLAGSELTALRGRQSLSWMWSEVTETLLQQVREDAEARLLVGSLETAVADGVLSPAAAAQELLSRWRAADR
ncbi:MAG: methylmalonyl Co-A mutase-associated GTPase MeaB, partial [Acidimicrobiales bacterium]